ncbi:MAG: hypothetical protein Q4C47_07265 [Planctomycetia bacterium]|nr:hypothetical protein [Planctomycetia bacterium]
MRSQNRLRMRNVPGRVVGTMGRRFPKRRRDEARRPERTKGRSGQRVGMRPGGGDERRVEP